MARVVLAMSGGVDSSVAAALLREAGHDVVGVFMRHASHAPVACASDQPSSAAALTVVDTTPGHKQGCCSASDAEDARRVAQELGIPFYALDLTEGFDRIVDYFVDEYLHARTPNPCVMCNNWLKFGKLFEYADAIEAPWVASGHYARIVQAADGPALARGRDDAKDQSYVLFGIRRELLSRMMLPVGEYSKPEIREMAHALGLRVADKRDSQEICFVPRDDYAEFVRSRSGPIETAGEIVTMSGDVVGTHSGIENFTVGQRKGLGVAFGQPRFVVRLEPDTRRVVVGSRDELSSAALVAGRTNWLVDEPADPIRCQVKIRYNSPRVWGEVQALEGGRMSVRFDEPQFAVAPGQAVVCYADDRVLGGGWIEA